MKDRIETHLTSGRGRVMLWRNVIIDYAAETRVETVKALRSVLPRWCRRAPTPLALFVYMPEEAMEQQASDEFRAELAQLWKQIDSTIAAHALVFPGAGFKAAAFRGLLTSLNLRSQRPFPQFVAASIPAAAQWLEQRMNGAGAPFGSSSELEATLAEALPR
jgi:hypothetical protein